MTARTREQELLDLSDKATPRPWKVHYDDPLVFIDGESPDVCVVGNGECERVEEDAAFIVAAANAVPAMARVVAAVRGLLSHATDEAGEDYQQVWTDDLNRASELLREFDGGQR